MSGKYRIDSKIRQIIDGGERYGLCMSEDTIVDFLYSKKQAENHHDLRFYENALPGPYYSMSQTVSSVLREKPFTWVSAFFLDFKRISLWESVTSAEKFVFVPGI